ncbi:hypothetical protein ES703_81080 [subsurface metagenome]
MIYSWNSLSDGHKLLLSCLGGLLEGPDDLADTARIYSFLKKNKVKLPFKRERLHVLLEEAYHQELLEKQENQKYRFRMDLLRRWIGREHSIWKVTKEFGLESRKILTPALLLLCAGLLILAGFAAWIAVRRGPALLGRT